MRKCLLFILLCFVVVTSFGQTTDTANKLQIKILPIVNKLQYVGDHPYDWNDGVMIPAKGWQQY